MRLVNADSFRSGWNSDSVIGTTMQRVIDELPTIDPETLPIVQQLWKELNRVTAERDAAVADLRKLVPAWKWNGQKEEVKNEDN